jgi:hypothetical protein
VRYLLLMLMPAITLAGCNSLSEPKNETPPLDLTTPGKALEALASVWTNYRDIDSYKRLLTQLNPPAYQFYFNPCIIPPLPPRIWPLPPEWTYMEDIDATSNMFTQAYDIRLEILNAADFDDPDLYGNFYRADNVMLLFRIYPTDGDFYYEASGPCDFEFWKVGDIWLISAWYDRTGGTESEQSLGELRMLFQ